MTLQRERTRHEIVQVLEICRDIEQTAAQLYLFYAELFKNDVDASRLWTKTAMEEEEHGKQFIMAITLRNQWEVEDVTVDKVKAEGMLKLITTIFETVQKYKPTLIDALSSAINLELSLAEFHMHALARFTNDYHRKFFQSLMQADRRHVIDLEEAHKKLSQESTDWVVHNE